MNNVCARVRKHRFLKRQFHQRNDDSDSDIVLSKKSVSEDAQNPILLEPTPSDGDVEVSRQHFSANTDRKSQVGCVGGTAPQISISQGPNYSSDEEHTQKNIVDDIRSWAINHINHLRNNATTELLSIFRSYGHEEVPKTAEALFQTRRTRDIEEIPAAKGIGRYVYFGIRCELNKRICPATYTEEKISVLVNVDGFPLYRNSKQQCWPILLQIHHQRYESKPFPIALFCGGAKPNDCNEFLKDFVSELKILIPEGFSKDGRHYQFELKAIVCDTPARAFMKSIKGHGGFYACERCEIRGITINKRRIYAQTNCPRRTAESFKSKLQPEHHQENKDSLLLQIPQFDIIKDVVLDYMHLLCIGVMKSLLEKWMAGNNMSRLQLRDRNALTALVRTFEPNIPSEFQRKTLDLSDLSHWKATQFRCFLLYVGGLVLKNILPSGKYKHFMLLYCASRILCDPKLCVVLVEYARDYLLTFVKLMPSLYGTDSQVMNIHNLIHVADDVEHMGMPLSDFSSFPFESCLGRLKKLVRTPHLAISQICRRLSELEGTANMVIRSNSKVEECISAGDKTNANSAPETASEFTRLAFKGMVIAASSPDNYVQLHEGTIFEIQRIFSDAPAPRTGDEVKIEGYRVVEERNVFSSPCDSSRLGIYELKNTSAKKQIIQLVEVEKKCARFVMNDHVYVISLLHE